MSAASPISFWVIAVAGSVALHGAIGMALYAMPMPETRKPSRTEIDIATLATGGAQQIAVPENVSVIEAERPAILVPASASVLAAKDAGVGTEAVRAEPGDTLTAKASASVEPVADSKTVVQSTEVTQAAPPSAEATSQAVPANPVQALAEPDAATQTAETVAKPDADVPNSPDASTPVRTSATAAPAVPSAPPHELPAAASTETVAVASVETATPLPSAVPQIAPAASTAVETVTSLEAATPLIATGRAAETAVTATLDEPASNPSPVSAPTRPATIAPNGGATVAAPKTAATPVATSSGKPAESAAVVVAPTRPSGAAFPSAVVAHAPTVVARTPASQAPATAEAQVAALLPRPDVLTDGDVTDGATSGTLRVAEFLATHRGDDCLLALPASINPTQASIQAYTAAPETVGRLGAEYERLSGLKLKADTKTVSKDQCGALAFARSLAQYPNFPLRVTLDQSTIESGHDLSGAVSGLRKDTLYLMVIDDEGKAKLVTSYAGQHAVLMNFKEPMTLTSGPVSSVQLLVAIASDGPLRTVPTRPGLPAEEYFSRLATEIIAGNRSIAYGITSFVVR